MQGSDGKTDHDERSLISGILMAPLKCCSNVALRGHRVTAECLWSIHEMISFARNGTWEFRSHAKP